ncbi:MAG: hypothetical protein LW701_10405 [Fluviicola sp.]|jgi:hypothetical protein|nr:hypothetical protein [Fluviicola sp.]
MSSEIKVFCYSIWQKVILVIIFPFLGLFGLSYIYTYTFIGIFIGSLLFLFILFLILTRENYILFFENHFEIKTVTFRIKLNYSEIDKLKFHHPSKDSPNLTLMLKRRFYWRKKFIISVKNPREKLRDVLNHARSKGVKTALNKVGEEYLVFHPDEGIYSAKEVKYNKY